MHDGHPYTRPILRVLNSGVSAHYMAFPQLDQCALCGDRAPLQRSHIIPAFVYRNVMPDTGRFYSAFHPKKLIQGGERVHLLCQRCESRTSLFEREFQTLFFPSGKIASLPLVYDQVIYKFCCSVSWRILTYLKISTTSKYVDDSNISKMLHSNVPSEHHDRCDEKLEHWAKTMLTGTWEDNDQHVVFLNGKLVPFERSDIIGFHVFQSSTNLATVAILGPIVLLGFIHRSKGWENTSINPDGATLPIVSQSIPISFARWLHDLYFNLERIAH